MSTRSNILLDLREIRRREMRPGMTLVEIMVVLLIAVAMLSLVIGVTGMLTFGELSGRASRLAMTIEHIYGRSAINGQRYRLVIDLDEQTYYAECSEENVPLTMEMVENEEPVERAADRFARYDEDETEGDPFGLNLENTFDDCSEDLIPPINLKELGDVVIDSVMTTHQIEPLTRGQASVEFFPDGFVEPALIWLRRGDDPEDAAWATLDIDPMSGNVTVTMERLEIPDDYQDVEEDR